MATRKRPAKKAKGKKVSRTVTTKSIFGLAAKDKGYKRAKVAAKKAASKASKLYKAAIKKARAAKRKARR